MVGLLGYKGLLAKYPARILLTPNLKVPARETKQYADILHEFEHYENNAKAPSATAAFGVISLV